MAGTGRTDRAAAGGGRGCGGERPAGQGVWGAGRNDRHHRRPDGGALVIRPVVGVESSAVSTATPARTARAGHGHATHHHRHGVAGGMECRGRHGGEDSRRAGDVKASVVFGCVFGCGHPPIELAWLWAWLWTFINRWSAKRRLACTESRQASNSRDPSAGRGVGIRSEPNLRPSSGSNRDQIGDTHRPNL